MIMSDDKKARFCQLVEDAIKDEKAGIEMWDRLKAEFPERIWITRIGDETASERVIIGKAAGFFRDDEKKHLEVLELMKKMKC